MRNSIWTFSKSRLFIPVAILFGLLLVSGAAFAEPETVAERDANISYIKGVDAFNDGRDREAVELLTEAAGGSGYCRAVFEDPQQEKVLLKMDCAAIVNEPLSGPVDDDPLDDVLFRLGSIRWMEETQALDESASPKRGMHSGAFYNRLLAECPESPFVAAAALRILEDGFCGSWSGYPDCAKLEIERYEEFLQAYPESELKPYVLGQMSERYLALAGFYDQARPWGNPALVELCRISVFYLLKDLSKRHADLPGAAAAKVELDRLSESLGVTAYVPGQDKEVW